MRSSSFGTPATTRPPYDKWICHLSKNELHAATCEYDRVRGHFQGLNFDRFRDTVVIEALAGFPEYFAQRLFREWNVSGDGELSRSEFIAAAAAAGKSLRGDHIEMVFRMISANGDGTNVSRSDVARFLKCFDPGPHFMGIDRRTTSVVRQSWAGDKFLRMLFGSSTTERLTLEKLGTVLGSSTAFDAFIEWIPNLGARLLCPQDDFVPHAAVIQRFTDFKLFHVRNAISLKQREEFRSELRTILFILSTESPSLTSAYIIDRFRDVLDEDSLIDTIVTAWNIANAGKDLNSSEKLEAPAVREEFKLFVLGYCCAHASSVHQVYRLLFELFDEDRCGQIEVEQLSAFLQLAVDLSPIDSEREANIIIRRRGRSHSPSLSPPPSPHGLSITPSGRPQILSLHQFIEVAQDLPGFSLAEIETAFLLFHIKQHGSQIRRDSSPDMIGDDHLLLMNLFDDYFSEETAQSFAFCLLSPKEWQQLMNGIMRCPNDLSAAQILHQEAIELPSGHMMLTLPVWLLTSFWYGMKPRESLKFSANWASSIHLYRRDQSFLHGFWIRISINFTSCDGFERAATIPQVIAFEQCNVRSVLNAALSQKGWGGHDEEETSGVTTMCQCQVLIAQRNDAGEIKTLIQQGDPMIISQDQLMIPLGSIFPSLFSSWVFGNFVNDGNRSFELRFSVVEIEPQDDSVQVEGLTGINLPCNAMESTTSTFFNQYASWSTGAIPRGLINLGNTCFMNAVIQCLATTPLLQAYIIGTEHRQEFISLHSPAASRKTTTQPASNSLICTLRELFVGMHPRGQGIANDERSLSPANVLGALSIHSPHMFDGTQQDAQEFLVCLLGFLGDTLKRRPTHTQNSESRILSPRSHTVLTNLFKPKDDKSTTDKLSSQLCVGDSNGRHDRVVATEWWVSHIVHEPSVTNILFSGQFKSALICTRCTHQSARFEPFSSLQLPLIEDNTNFQASNEGQRYLVVIIHFAESSRNSVGARGPVRAVVQINDHSTVGDVITRLTTFRSKPGSCEYIVGRFEEYTIQNLLVSDRTEDQIEDQTPASALPSPMHAFEAFNITGSGDDTVTPTSESTKVYVRFVHRQSFLVPFYCTTPTRQALCGSPFVCSSICGALTGQALHQMVLRRFLCGHNSRSKPRSSNTNSFKRQTEGSAHHYAPTFSLRRVRDDGIACSRCHWGTGCRGCLIPPTATAAELLDLENCATISIDWDTQLHPQYPSAFWWLQSYPTRDHSSYIHYLRTKTHPLTKSLQSLCSTEHLDASCSQCQQSTPHTKQLSLWSLPPVLVLQLKRFELCTTNGNYQWRKLCHDVDFPVRGLDLRDLLSPIDGGHDDSEPCTDRCFVDALDPRVRLGIEYLQNELNIPLSSASRSCTKYDLYAVVNHCGRGISSGHYTAHIRRPDESRWWLADDTVVTPLREDELSPSATTYLLFYVRQDIASGATELSDLFPTESD